MAEKSNGNVEEDQVKETTKDNNLYGIIERLILEHCKIKASQFPEASRNYSRHLLLWSRHASPLQLFLFISVGIVGVVAVSGLVAFMLFFVAATINAIFVSLLISLAVAAGFLALFLAFLTVVYIGALSVAIFAISTVVFWALVAIVVTAGCVGFFYTVWLITRKSLEFAKQYLSVTSSAITTYSAVWGTRNLVHKDSI